MRTSWRRALDRAKKNPRISGTADSEVGRRCRRETYQCHRNDVLICGKHRKPEKKGEMKGWMDWATVFVRANLCQPFALDFV